MSEMFSVTRNLLYLKLFINETTIFSILYLLVYFIIEYKQKTIHIRDDIEKAPLGFKDLYLIYLFSNIIYYISIYIIPAITSNLELIYFVQESWGILFVFVLIAYRNNINISNLKNILIKKPEWKKGVFIGIIIALIYVSIYPLTAALNIAKNSQNILFSVNSVYGLVRVIITYGIITPLVEELFFRGFIYNLIRTKVGIRYGLILSSIIFISVHGINIMILLFVQSLIYGYLFEKTESIIMPALFHSYNNLILLILSVYNGYIFKHFTIAYYIYFVFFTVGFVYTIYLAFISKKQKIW